MGRDGRAARDALWRWCCARGRRRARRVAFRGGADAGEGQGRTDADLDVARDHAIARAVVATTTAVLRTTSCIQRRSFVKPEPAPAWSAFTPMPAPRASGVT